MQETIIITGGRGFVGRHLVTELRRGKKDARLIVWDTTVSELPPGVRGVAIDITEPATYRESLRAAQPQWIVHLAAATAVGASWQNPGQTQRLNVDATRLLLETAAAASPATRVLAVSSADIYGPDVATSSEPLTELPLAAARPVSPYGASKLQMEKLIEADFNDRVLRVRPFPHIGPGQRPGFVVADFASQIAAAEAAQPALVVHVGNLEAVRDFTDVRDVVRAYRLLIERGKVGEVYHVASGRGVKIKNLLEQLLSLSTKKITVEQDPSRLRPSDTPYVVGDASKLHQATGWQPMISLEQTLHDVLDTWRDKYKVKN